MSDPDYTDVSIENKLNEVIEIYNKEVKNKTDVDSVADIMNKIVEKINNTHDGWEREVGINFLEGQLASEMSENMLNAKMAIFFFSLRKICSELTNAGSDGAQKMMKEGMRALNSLKFTDQTYNSDAFTKSVVIASMRWVYSQLVSKNNDLEESARSDVSGESNLLHTFKSYMEEKFEMMKKVIEILRGAYNAKKEGNPDLQEPMSHHAITLLNLALISYNSKLSSVLKDEQDTTLLGKVQDAIESYVGEVSSSVKAMLEDDGAASEFTSQTYI